MIDIHAHILPGVDDGPRTWDDALAIIEMAAEDGIRGIVSTSHMHEAGPYKNNRTILLEKLAELKEKVADAEMPVELYAGGEVHLMPSTATWVANKEALTYCDAGRYILIELPTMEIPSFTKQVLFDLQVQGLIPIIAHPERNRAVMRNPERLFSLIARGALVQITAGSLVSNPFAETTEILLKHDAVHFVATDTHGVRRRPPVLSMYEEHLCDIIGEEKTKQILWKNPRFIIEGKPLAAPPVRPMEQPKRRGILGRLFKNK